MAFDFLLRILQVRLGQMHVAFRGAQIRVPHQLATLNTSMPASTARVP